MVLGQGAGRTLLVKRCGLDRLLSGRGPRVEWVPTHVTFSGYSRDMHNPNGSIKVKVNLVDGSLNEFNQPLGIIAKYDRLVHQGLQGKALIHELLTDDWGLPPVRVTLSFVSVDGKPIEIVIPYR